MDNSKEQINSSNWNEYRNWIVDTLSKLDERSTILLDYASDLKTRITIAEHDMSEVRKNTTENKNNLVSFTDKINDRLTNVENDINKINITLATTTTTQSNRHESYNWVIQSVGAIMLCLLSAGLAAWLTK